MELAYKIPVCDIQEDILINGRGDYSIGFELFESEVFTLDDAQNEKVHEIFVQIVNSLPAYTVMHKQDIYTKEPYKAEIKKMANYLSRSFELAYNEKEFIRHKAYIFFTQSTSAITNRKSTTSFLAKNFPVHEIVDKTKYTNFLSSIDAIESFVNASGLISIKRLEKKDYVGENGCAGIMNNYLTLSDEKEITDINIEKGLKIGNNICSIYSVGDLEQYPSSINLLSTDNRFKFPFTYLYKVGLGIKINHIVNQIIVKDDSTAAYEKLNDKRKGLSSFASVSPANQDNAIAIREFLEKANKGESFVRFHLNVMTWAENQAEAKANTLIISSELQGLKLIPKKEIEDQPLLYFTCFPGAASDIPKRLTATMFTNVACCMLVNETCYSNSISDYGLKLIDRDTDKPIHVDITDEPFKKGYIQNFHKFAIGGSGGGKSAFTNAYIYNSVLSGGHVIMIDVGNSYKRLAKSFGTKHAYFEFKDNKPISFNPFFIKTPKEANSSKVEMLNALILGICMGIDIEEQKASAAIMRKLITEYYNYVIINKYFPCMNSFYEFIQREKQRLEKSNSNTLNYLDFNELLIVLSEYYKGGIYEYLLNAKENVDLLDKQFIVFELDSIKDNPLLLSIVTTMIISLMMDKLFLLENLYGQDAYKIVKSLMLDEAWQALMNKKMAVFLKWAVKTLRKHNGELFTITQELNDLIDNPIVKDTLVANMPTKIIFDISSYSSMINKIGDLLGLTTKEKNLIYSLNKDMSDKEKYREVLIKTGGISKVYKSKLSPEQLAMYTTEKTQSGIINDLVEKFNGDVEMAIKEYIN